MRFPSRLRGFAPSREPNSQQRPHPPVPRTSEAPDAKGRSRAGKPELRRESPTNPPLAPVKRGRGVGGEGATRTKTKPQARPATSPQPHSHPRLARTLITVTCASLRGFAASREPNSQQTPLTPVPRTSKAPDANGRSRAGKPELRRESPADSHPRLARTLITFTCVSLRGFAASREAQQPANAPHTSATKNIPSGAVHTSRQPHWVATCPLQGYVVAVRGVLDYDAAVRTIRPRSLRSTGPQPPQFRRFYAAKVQS